MEILHEEQGADLHMAQLIPMPLTVSCVSKIQIDFIFLVPATPGCPLKRLCVCCMLLMSACVSVAVDNGKAGQYDQHQQFE